MTTALETSELNLRKALESRQLRYTKQRQAIFDFLQEPREKTIHPTAEEVFTGVKEYSPQVSLATVYKTLDALVECELLRRIKFSNGSTYYDPRLDAHHHTYCLDSGTISDVGHISDETIIDAMVLPEGFRVDEVQVELEGWCAECGHNHKGDVEAAEKELEAAIEKAMPQDGSDPDPLRLMLEVHSLRFTQQRQLVYEHLQDVQKRGVHPTAESVFNGVKAHMPSISLATVYNALETLQKCGLVQKVQISRESAHYDFRTDNHHHAYCQKCSTIYDIETKPGVNLARLLNTPKTFDVQRERVSITGCCC
jgi:Fe2+ or Zn2+ uptake regulation protein